MLSQSHPSHIDINMDDSDDIDGDDGDDNKTTNNVCKDSFDAAAAPTTTTDTNEIDIDIDDESEEDTEVKAVAKKARLEDWVGNDSKYKGGCLHYEYQAINIE